MKPLPAGGVKMAILRIISERSIAHASIERSIYAAVTLREIENDLKKIYNVDMTKKQIRKHIKDLGRFIIEKRDPSNRTRMLYRINPKLVESQVFTQIKLGEEQILAHGHGYEGILTDPPPEDRFFAIDRVNYPMKARTNRELEVEVKVNYSLTKPTSVFLVLQSIDRDKRRTTSKPEVLKGDGLETFTLKLTAPENPGEWKLRVKAYLLEGLRWLETDSVPIQLLLDKKYPREIEVSGGKTVGWGDHIQKIYYKLTIEVENEEEVEEAKAYGRAIINSWLAEPPTD